MASEHAPIDVELEGATDALVQALRSTGVYSENLIPDLVAVGLARDVFENARATLMISRSDVPRAVYPTARAAFEAAQDLALLVTSPEYTRAGARAFAAELLDWEHTATTASAVFDARGEPDPIEFIPADTQLEEAAGAWEQYAPGSGDVLRNAFHTVKTDRRKGRFHWSGLSRSGIHKELGTRPGANPGMTELYRSWYNILSFQAHPSPRLDTRHMRFSESSGISFVIEPETPGALSDMGLGAALIAVRTATVLLDDLRKARPGA